MKYKELFKVGGEVDKKTENITTVFGWLLLLFIWWFVTYFGFIKEEILASPISVDRKSVV